MSSDLKKEAAMEELLKCLCGQNVREIKVFDANFKHRTGSNYGDKLIYFFWTL